MSEEFEIIEIPFEDQQNGACNTVTLGTGKFVMDSVAEKSAEIIARRGYTPILTPYQTNWHTFHSGIHCSTLRIMAE